MAEIGAGIDPWRIWHHRSLMNKATSLQHVLSIRRHAVQQLLRQALDATPQPVCGLLGGHGHSVEAVLALHGATDAGDVHAAVQAWQDKGIRLLAIYSSAETAAEKAASHPQHEPRLPPLPIKLLPEAFSNALSSLPLLIISADTKGCIEAKLLSPAAGRGIQPSTLEMQEDGGLSPSRDTG